MIFSHYLLESRNACNCQWCLFKSTIIECTSPPLPGALVILSAMSLSCKMFQQALPLSRYKASIRGQQWVLKVIPTPPILCFQKRPPLIGREHIPLRQLHPCLLCLAPPGSKSQEAEVLLVLKAEQYPDNFRPRLAVGCNIYHRRESWLFDARQTITFQGERTPQEVEKITGEGNLE